ncbi:Electron transfer flavoprotein alpha subunit [Xylanimonas cellulosilytica DSM 15894]|uniref:Electron transfer flavoprotein alpha subunit n=1 Tax=Xylanimonas cellulosilytica (strain DSM 15894 / JCM 12276 / CECT 5975 / KCTC 9989 / LMG 20990 / NBRC 107835 / XIL07) TaxID=446471 RepID=D1BVV7_XYLCX|nr:electron transfer flavoprotein subunit alpha/FixB family protein [Xylanimonas cellulosilytica]ACZ31426.1 Electron transfer flavoprotein alpha subunit [Xylanimonas cellulosilytica DSM 15894]
MNTVRTRPTVLVLLDSPTRTVDEVRPAVLELITLGRTLGRVDVVTLGAPSVEVLATLGAYGVELVHQAQLPTSVPESSFHLTSVLAAVLTTAVRRNDADVLLVPSSFAGKEAAAVTAAHLGSGLVVDASALEWTTTDGGGEAPLRIGKRVFAGTWDTVSTVASDPAVVTIRANAVVAEPAESAGHATVEPLPVEVHAPAVTVVERRLKERTVGRPTLEEAAVVVAGGRGTNGDFGPVNELAEALGAAVGATRDAVFEGWFDRYIGQTGVTVAPRLYIGAGISGAPHHRGGMQASQVVVSVNNDPEAPIFEISDFAVVGDLADVLSQAAAVIREHKAATD